MPSAPGYKFGLHPRPSFPSAPGGPSAHLLWAPGTTRLGPLAWDHSPGSTRLGPLAWDHSPGSTGLGPLAWVHSPGTTGLGPLAWVHWPGTTRLGPGPTRRHPHQEGQGSASDCRVYFVEKAESTGSCSPGQGGAWLSDHLSHSLKQAPLLRTQRLGGSSMPRPGERPWKIGDQEWLSCYPDRERALKNDDNSTGSSCHSKRTEGTLRRETKQAGEA